MSSVTRTGSGTTAEPLAEIGDERADRHVHRVVGGPAEVRAPADPSIGSDDDEGVSVPGFPHHPVAVRVVGGGDAELRIGKDGERDALVGYLLADQTRWVG